jgi:hypothetical protein
MTPIISPKNTMASAIRELQEDKGNKSRSPHGEPAFLFA